MLVVFALNVIITRTMEIAHPSRREFLPAALCNPYKLRELTDETHNTL